MAEFLPHIVGDEEDVARVIFSPSYIFKGRVAPTAFRWDVLQSGTAEDYISVLRGDFSLLDAQTVGFKARTEGDMRYGYAQLHVGEIRKIGNDGSIGIPVKVDVQPFPSKAHPNHAGIVVDMSNERVTAFTPVTPEIMMIQKELASLCSEIIQF